MPGEKAGIKFNTRAEHEKESLDGPNITNTQTIVVDIASDENVVPDIEGGSQSAPWGNKLLLKIGRHGKTRT